MSSAGVRNYAKKKTGGGGVDIAGDDDAGMRTVDTGSVISALKGNQNNVDA